jgi:hypothetical protein
MAAVIEDNPIYHLFLALSALHCVGLLYLLFIVYAYDDGVINNRRELIIGDESVAPKTNVVIISGCGDATHQDCHYCW